jgi:hypothetical protein
MNFNKKYMLFSFVVILAAIIANYSFQQNYKGKQQRRRQSIYFGKNEVVKNIFLAKAKNPQFLTFVENKLKKELSSMMSFAQKNRVLSGREWLIYAEALGFYNSERARKLMEQLYQQGGIKTHNRVVKGLGESRGKWNRKLLSKIEQHLPQMNDLEKVTFFLAKYKQYDDKQHPEVLNSLIKQLRAFLSFHYPMVNFSILKFFAEQGIIDNEIRSFSKQVVEKVLNGQRLSPVLLTSAVTILLRSDFSYIQKRHRELLTKPDNIFIRFYISTLRKGCIVDLDFVRSMLRNRELSFDIFRPLVSELRFIGGDKVFTLLEELSQQKLGEKRIKFLQKALAKVRKGKSQICPKLF